MIHDQMVQDLEASMYIFVDDILEDSHLCAFTAKVQAHQDDPPTFKDIFKCLLRKNMGQRRG